MHRAVAAARSRRSSSAPPPCTLAPPPGRPRRPGRRARPRPGSPTCPRFTPSSGTSAGRAISAARSRVPSPPRTMTISAPSSRLGAWPAPLPRPGTAGRRPRCPRTRTDTRRRSACPPPAGRCAPPRPRPVCAVTSTVRWRSLAVPPRSPAASCRRRAAARRGAARGNTPRFPAGPGSGLAVTPATPEAGARAAAATPATARRAIRPIPHHAARAHPALAHLELRLDEQQEVGVRAAQATRRGQHQVERDEREVGRDQVRAPARPAPAQRAAR